ncbi:ArsR family transcriptional regulator [Candidatus Woesearchaeota archaeon]|nr:MAG: ArsR family transcriptional regulator [Candidatus Woesearchaeota archaeon]
MGQFEVFSFLHKADGWFTSREIAEQLGASLGSVTMSLKKLRESNLIDCRSGPKQNSYVYRGLCGSAAKKKP